MRSSFETSAAAGVAGGGGGQQDRSVQHTHILKPVTASIWEDVVHPSYGREGQQQNDEWEFTHEGWSSSGEDGGEENSYISAPVISGGVYQGGLPTYDTRYPDRTRQHVVPNQQMWHEQQQHGNVYPNQQLGQPVPTYQQTPPYQNRPPYQGNAIPTSQAGYPTGAYPDQAYQYQPTYGQGGKQATTAHPQPSAGSPTTHRKPDAPLTKNNLQEFLESNDTGTGTIPEIRLVNFLIKRADARVRPSYLSGKPVHVECNLFIRSISSINEMEMQYMADILFRQNWVDDRLALDFSGSYEYLSIYQGQKIWQPDLYFKNAKEAHFHTVLQPQRLLRLKSHGTMLSSIRVTMILSCNMKLQYFPFDSQQCFIWIGSFSQTTEHVILSWKADGGVSWDKDLELPQYDMLKPTLKEKVYSYATGNYSNLFVFINLKRKYGFYIVEVYFPSCMIVIVSWVSFWLDVESGPARVSLAITTLLTMSTMSSGIRANLPPVSYTKAIDVWTGVCTAFIFGALLEYALANYMLRYDKRIAEDGRRSEGPNKSDKTNQNLTSNDDDRDEWEVRGGPIAGFGLTSNTLPNSTAIDYHGDIDDHLRGRMPRDTSRSSISRYADKLVTKAKSYVHSLNHRRRAKRVDVVSRILFPFIYLVFNIVYWVYYIVLNNNIAVGEH